MSRVPMARIVPGAYVGPRRSVENVNRYHGETRVGGIGGALRSGVPVGILLANSMYFRARGANSAGDIYKGRVTERSRQTDGGEGGPLHRSADKPPGELRTVQCPHLWCPSLHAGARVSPPD